LLRGNCSRTAKTVNTAAASRPLRRYWRLCTATRQETSREASAHTDTFSRDHLPPLDQWPELLLDGNPDVAYPARLNCAAALVDERVAQGQGDRIALRWRDASGQCSMDYYE